MDDKIIIRLVATGNAPLLKQPTIKISSSQAVDRIYVYVAKQLALSEKSSLFLYVNASFVPGMDVTIGNLRDCFSGSSGDGSLTINYSLTPAWG